ncbi:MAG: outer membrane protein transport protein [Rhodospirillales bacterium]|nr:MAG: outer membrane protein transport protein [Rhodospirillales bacterium]
MKKILYGCAAGLVAGATFGLAPAQATEGYFSHGYGAINKSMAGAGVAADFDAMSQATNPASLTGVDSQFNVDLSVFSPRRKSTLTGTGFNNGVHTSDNNYFLIPSLAARYEIDAVSAWGWAIYGNGGMNTTYPPVGPFGSTGQTGVDLAQLFLQGTYARDVGSGVSLGISPIFAMQRFKAYGISAFSLSSSDPTKLTNNGYDWSYGVGGRLGLQWDIVPAVSFGVAYQSRTYMTEFDKYKGLFAEQGDFDIPPALQAGFAWKATPGLTLLADWKRIWYSDVKAVANPISNLTVGGQLLGTDNGAGFGWQDVDAFKFGVQWQTTPTVALRAGVGFNDNPIPASEVLFNILAPGVQEQHYTAGLTWQHTPNSAFNFGGMYSPSTSVTGPDPLGSPGTIKIEMYQWELTAGWTWTF